MTRERTAPIFTAIDGEDEALGDGDFMILAPEVKAEVLLQELTCAGREAARFLVTDPRFHRCDLLDLLLRDSQATLLEDPIKASNFATLAARLADSALPTLPVTAPQVIFQADLLAANAFRLARNHISAEKHLWRATPERCVIQVDDLDRANFCRTLGLVRWERGQLDEGLGLLKRASQLFDSCRRLVDSVASLLLTTLLLDELGSFDNCELLEIGTRLIWNPALESCPPWLVSRASLTLASSFPNAYADAAFTQGIRQLGSITDPEEQYRLFRLEGRARALRGFPSDGERILEAVRREHLSSQSLVDLTLTSIDLLALRTSQNQDPRIEEIEAPILGISSELGALSSSAIDRFISQVGGDTEPWQAARAAISWFLVRARFLQMGPAPLPFT